MKHDTTKASRAFDQACANLTPKSLSLTVSVGGPVEVWMSEAPELFFFFPLAMAADSSTMGVGKLGVGKIFWQAEERPPVPDAAMAAAPSCPHIICQIGGIRLV